MSVIVRTPGGKIQIWCKGADSRLQGDEKNQAIIDPTSSESIMDFMQTETDRYASHSVLQLAAEVCDWVQQVFRTGAEDPLVGISRYRRQRICQME